MSRTINYGIDLGTTNSCVAKYENGETRIFQSNDQMNVTPSAVYISRSGRTLVGRRALAAGESDVDNLATEFKRWLGQREQKTFSAGAAMLPEELSAEVLKALLENVSRLTGDVVRDAVVTVPAAFGTLQCDATARAARLAGLNDPVLLQEPIAAAVAYGAQPGSANERWLVFDLGGGTLDVAVVSTKDGHLSVLGHRGNNMLGGKDITRAVVTEVLIPSLARQYELPALETHPELYRRLVRRLTPKAEEAKIDVSTSASSTISLIDVGEDLRGVAIDAEVVVRRDSVEAFLSAMMTKCIALTYEVLKDASLGPGEIAKIILVGGPTQTPFVRSTLKGKLGVPIDYSLDPMTVVARGAAIFASAQMKKADSAAPASPGRVGVKLAFDPVSSTPQTIVSGSFSSSEVAQAKIDADTGLWTSGWFAIDARDPFFEQPVQLQRNTSTKFWLYARRQDGTLLTLDANEFEIRHGLVVGAPPLPHSIAIEVRRSDGRSELDKVFDRGTPLPAQKVVRYRADRTLRPTDAAASLPIKLWEGECDGDPQSNEWVGHMIIEGKRLKRPLPEGSEIELTIKVDASRLLTVDAYIPYLNEQFSEEIYVAQREERNLREDITTLPRDLEQQFEKLETLREEAAYAEDSGLPREVEVLRRRAEDVDLRANETARRVDSEEPDAIRRVFDDTRELRQDVVDLERRLASSLRVQSMRLQSQSEETGAVVRDHGDYSAKQELDRLKQAGERALLREDATAADRAISELRRLYWNVLFSHDWFWTSMLEDLRNDRRLEGSSTARSVLSQADAAQQGGDSAALRENVWQLWKLYRGTAGDDRLRAVAAGLRKY